MSHADEFIRAIWAELRPIYPAIPEIRLEDEQSGDFGVAHYRSTDENGVALLTFDDDKQPSRAVVAHELFHAAHANAGGEPRFRITPDPVLEGYWPLMGYTTSYEDAWSEATAKQWWGLYPGEQIADVFARVAVGRCGGCADVGYFGASYDDQAALARVDAFFRSLRPKTEEMEVTEDQIREIAKAECRAVLSQEEWLKDTVTLAVDETLKEVSRRLLGATGRP